MDVSDILDATRQANIDVPGAFPAQRTRRDCTTREAGSGRPRLYRTWINGRTIVYPSTISLRQARQTYLEAHGDEHEKQAC